MTPSPLPCSPRLCRQPPAAENPDASLYFGRWLGPLAGNAGDTRAVAPRDARHRDGCSGNAGPPPAATNAVEPPRSLPGSTPAPARIRDRRALPAGTRDNRTGVRLPGPRPHAPRAIRALDSARLGRHKGQADRPPQAAARRGPGELTANRSPGLRFSSAQLQHSRGPKLPSRPRPNGRQRQLLLSARAHRQLGKSNTGALDINDVAAVARKTFFGCSSAEGRAPTFSRSPQRGLVLASKTGLILESASGPAAFTAFPALYVAEDYDTAFRERFAGPSSVRSGELSAQELALRSPGSFTQVRVDFRGR